MICNNYTCIDQILHVMLSIPHLLAHGYQTLFNKLYIFNFLYEKEFGNGDDVQKGKDDKIHTYDCTIHTIIQIHVTY